MVNDTRSRRRARPARGTVDVTVTTPDGTGTSAGDVHLLRVAPTVTGLSPTSGPAAGGTSVTITGTGFTGATAVKFGATAATSFTVVNATQITAVTAAGTRHRDVTVTTPDGTSPHLAGTVHFTRAAPDGHGPGPTFGPAAGGTGDDHRHRLHRCDRRQLRRDRSDARSRW